MGDVRQHKPVLLFAAISSRYRDAIDWAREQAVVDWGSVALESADFEFDDTTYYNATMGEGLKKRLIAFECPIGPDALPEIKLRANQLERDYSAEAATTTPDRSELRPVNIDPGYVSEAKLVLATTKDRDHRIYLSRGIFAEVTLCFHHGKWHTNRWTYPDYQKAEYHAFLDRCRQFLRQSYRGRN